MNKTVFVMLCFLCPKIKKKCALLSLYEDVFEFTYNYIQNYIYVCISENSNAELKLVFKYVKLLFMQKINGMY